MLRTCFVLATAFAVTLANCPEIVSRSGWNALPAKSRTALGKNQRIVVIHHTTDAICSDTAKCKQAVKNIQKFHQDTRKWADIGYNFLIGNDGKVYEGRGWANRGSHAPNYNARSIGIAFIGNFDTNDVPVAMANTAKQLIQCGVEGGYISSNYQIVGHRQVKATECPGKNLYKLIQSWPQFTASPPK